MYEGRYGEAEAILKKGMTEDEAARGRTRSMLYYGETLPGVWGPSPARRRGSGTVADLLECVLQIKGLRETLKRVEARAAAAAARPGARTAVASQVRQLLAAEECWQRFFRTSVGDRASQILECAVAGSPSQAANDLEQLTTSFVRARLSTLRLLDAASAVDLATAGDLPGRGRTTVADVIALMLADDTDQLGEMQRALAGGQ
jgi:hypothetical protein